MYEYLAALDVDSDSSALSDFYYNIEIFHKRTYRDRGYPYQFGANISKFYNRSREKCLTSIDTTFDLFSSRQYKIEKNDATNVRVNKPFLQRNLRATISSQNVTPVHRIAFYLRKYQEERWMGDLTCSTRNRIDELLMNCDDAEEDLKKIGPKYRSRFERKSNMIQCAFRKLRPVIENELERATKQRAREGESGRCTQ
jgi:hypothetical protein